MGINYNEKIFKSAPRIPKSLKYWKKKGKIGKEVCLIFHDDMDGIVSAIIMKRYLIKQGFKIVKYGIINYQQGWDAFELDPKLITIALDFSNDFEGLDVYIDHHGTFSEGEQKNRNSIKTATGSAAEGIALQIGESFSNDIKDWIDMIDSARYDDYGIDIRDILDFDFSKILKDKKPKLRFASVVNQMLKRGDHKSFIEVVHSCEYPSIYNIFRLFKLFYPKNNPDWITGVEPDFVEDGIKRLAKVQTNIRGDKNKPGYDSNGKKVIYNNKSDFWKTFANNLKYTDIDINGEVIYNNDRNKKWQIDITSYQIIGNLMFVPNGTWANALRARAVYLQDMDKGIVPDNKKLNFVLLQYGNTLQVADLRSRITDMSENDYPKYINGDKIVDLGEYCDRLLKNFEKHLGYKDNRTKAGGHIGIGSISNIFGNCKNEKYKNIRFLDMFKNKIINDISGVKFSLNIPWNENNKHTHKVRPEEINNKLLDISEIRLEKDVHIENQEKMILNKVISGSENYFFVEFKTDYIKKICEIWEKTNFSEIQNGIIIKKDLEYLKFKNNNKIEQTKIFEEVVNKFNLTDLYLKTPTEKRKNQRKKFKSVINFMVDIVNENKNNMV